MTDALIMCFQAVPNVASKLIEFQDVVRSASDRIKAMGQVLSKARDLLYDCKEITERLRAMLQSADEQVRSLEGRRRPRRRQSRGGGG